MAHEHDELWRRLARHQECPHNYRLILAVAITCVGVAIFVGAIILVIEKFSSGGVRIDNSMTYIFSGLMHVVLFLGALFMLWLIVSVLGAPIHPSAEPKELRENIYGLKEEIAELEARVSETYDDNEERNLEKKKDQLQRQLAGLREKQDRFASDLSSRQSRELIMRGVAVITGLLLYLGAKAAGLSIPSLSYDAMSTSFPFAIAMGGFVVPSLVGFVVSWFVIKHISGRDSGRDLIAMRVLSMMLSLVFFVYCDSYRYAFSEGATTVQYLPNLTFSLSILLYAVFKYQPHMPQSD